MNRVSDERLNEIVAQLGDRSEETNYVLCDLDAPYFMDDYGADLLTLSLECQAHRARLAQAQQVMDLEGLRQVLYYLHLHETNDAGQRDYPMFGIVLKHLAALEVGVQECPNPDCEAGTCWAETGGPQGAEPYPCPKCHGSGHGIWLAAKPAEEGETDE